MNENQNKYLSLKAAAQLYGYTRDHLGLMIRQGKLNGLKLGNYYVVTSDSMLQYVKNFADPSHPASKNKMSNRFLSEALNSNEEIKNIRAPVAPKQFTAKKRYEKKPENNLEKELREDLSLLSLPGKYPKEIKNENYIGLVKKIDNTENLESKLVVEHPYIILPIRKMNAGERDDVLSRV